ncbi:MAG: CoA pyrophosphatase [Clostridiaceae bacterium]
MVINTNFTYTPDNLEVFRNRKAKPLGEFRRSAVMILIAKINGEDHLILEKRAKNLRSQPGDISFPGGRIEDGETPQEAAIRETCEEIGLKTEDIDLMGPMDFFISPFNSIMYPFVARAKSNDFVINPDEVDRLIAVPIRYLIENAPTVHYVKLSSSPDDDFPYDLISNGRNYDFSHSQFPQLFWIYEGETIWGFTARIIKEFLDIINN